MRIKFVNKDSELKFVFEEDCKELGIKATDKNPDVILCAKKSEEEGFSLEREGKNACITYCTKVDFSRGLLHLASGKKHVKQKSSFKEFGYMLDVSRNGVGNIETVKKLIRDYSLLGYNLFGLYMEDTLCIDDEPYFGYMRGAYTKEELREINDYGKKLGVEVRPYLELLAHLNQLVNYVDYKPFFDCNDILLVGDERTYALIEKIIKRCTECFDTKVFHIGLDEAYLVGRGKYLDLNGYEDKTTVMSKHIYRIKEICDKYDLKLQMWGDMYFKKAYGYIDAIGAQTEYDIPEGIELVYWAYENQDKERYDKNFVSFKNMFGNRITFAGGAKKWSGFVPCNRFSIKVGKASIDSSKENNIKSYLVTGWGDDGAECSPFSTLPCLFADSQYNYVGELKDKDLFETLTGMRFDDFIAVDNPDFRGDDTKNSNATKYLLYCDPMYGVFDSIIPDKFSEFYAKTAKKLKEIGSKAGGYKYVFNTLINLCDLLSNKADFSVRLHKAYYAKDSKKLTELSEEITTIIQKIRTFEKSVQKQWMTDYKPFGYEIQNIRLGGLANRFRYVQKKLNAYLKGQISSIEELDAKQVKAGLLWRSDSDIDKAVINNWGAIVSSCVVL